METLMMQYIITTSSALFIIFWLSSWWKLVFIASLCIFWLFSGWKLDINSQQGAVDLLNLCKGTIAKSVKTSSRNIYLMNKQQHVLLIQRLSETRITLEKIQRSISRDGTNGKTIPVLQELLRTLLDAERVILSGGQITSSQWLRAAMEQRDMKETFSELLYDLKWHTDVLQSICGNSNVRIERKMCNGELSKEDEEALETAKKEDEMAFKNSLILKSKKLHDSTERELAIQLLEKMKTIEDQGEEQSRMDSKGVNLVTSSSNLLFLNPQILLGCHRGYPLGKGSGGEVRKLNLLGGTYAIKIMDSDPDSSSFNKEMAAIQKLGHHPHIVRLLCYSKNDYECFLIMEKMDMDLSDFLKERRNRGNKLSHLEAVVLMLKIAEGIRYIHSMHMAHRDLKPGNVLVNVDELLRACSIKITDFGLTKTKEASNTYSNQTWNTGTTRYMAPEVSRENDNMKPVKATLNPMKADAFSFGIMCYEILTLGGEAWEKAFQDLGIKEMKKKVKAYDCLESRPDFSKEEYFPRLGCLIERCWNGNFHIRPKFDEICEELRVIKGLILQGDHKELKVVHVDISNELKFKTKRAQDLLKLGNVNCQKDALLALYLLSQRVTIQTEELPFQVILGFLQPKWPKNVKGAAVGLLALMVKENEENAAKFMDTPEALKAVLHFLDKDAESPGSQQCASALLKMATEDKNASVRLGIAEWGLFVLIRFVRKHGTVDHKQLLTTTLGLLCKSGNGCEEAVTRAGGHTFLLTSLEENISKEVAAQGLLSLISNVRTAGDVLDAGFVDIAMGSIDRKLASTEMALGLASICSTSDWLDQIVACRRSVGALLILLERCPTLKGKGAAAAVIAKLYPRLTDSKRQEEMTEACSRLIKSLEHEDRSQLTAFLKALAAFATGRKGRHTIHEERGQIPLIRFLKAKETDTQVRDLVLQILAEMSSVFPEGTTKRDSSYHKILNVFMENMIGELLCPLPWEAEFKKNTESMKNVLILIRNLSLAGPAVVAHLSEFNAVPMLLHVLKDHDSAITPVTELAVKTLVKFTDDPNGKKAFLNGGGIKSLAAVLKLDVPRTSDVTSITTIILASVAKDRKTGTVACEAIFNCNILPALNFIIYEGETSRIKCQAAVLMKLLATTGPTQKVCAAIYQAGTLDALNYLRDVPHCEEIANDFLKIVRGANKDCKRYIDETMKKPR